MIQRPSAGDQRKPITPPLSTEERRNLGACHELIRERDQTIMGERAL